METMKPKTIAIILLALTAGLGLFNVFIMPPFMNPDEIQHFLYSADYAYDQKQLADTEKELIQILRDHKWFHFIGVGPGWESIQSVDNIFFLKRFSRAKRSISKSYFHYLYGKILEISGTTDTLTAFYFLRIISFFIYMGIFSLCLFYYKSCFPRRWLYLMSGQLLIYQLLTLLNSLNYDVLLALLGVLFFMFSYGFLTKDKG
ncbi:MAG: hypothetical protein GY765_35265, partial [bacterium]|nr:hypothetical protein [bacterium]